MRLGHARLHPAKACNKWPQQVSSISVHFRPSRLLRWRYKYLLEDIVFGAKSICCLCQLESMMFSARSSRFRMNQVEDLARTWQQDAVLLCFRNPRHLGLFRIHFEVFLRLHRPPSAWRNRAQHDALENMSWPHDIHIHPCNYQKSQLQCSRKKTLQTVTIIRLLVLGHSSKGNGRFAPHVIPSHGQISVWRLWTSPAKRPMPVFQFWPRYFWPTALSLQRLHISIPRGNINSSSERAMALAHKRWPLGRARLPKGSRLHSVNWTPLSWRSNTSTSLL